MLIIMRDIFNPFKGIAHCYPWNKSIFWAMGRGRMFKIKSSINTNSYNQKSLSEFRDTIIGKIIEMRCYYITGNYALKILDYLLNSFFLICRQQPFTIFCDKRLWLFCINKSKKTLVQISTFAIKSWLLPNNREILARESARK